jgi:predicted acetyltransferase
MPIVRIQTNEHHATLANLMQAYEAEFSDLTQKLPDARGVFKPDTCVDDSHDGYLLYNEHGVPLGFCIKGTINGFHDISEFYVIPAARRKRLGFDFATSIFNLYEGRWQVRQMWEASRARRFWKKTLEIYTGSMFEDVVIDDPMWGKMTSQRFEVKRAAVG